MVPVTRTEPESLQQCEIFTVVSLRIQVCWDDTLHCQMSGS